jgi:phosphatidylglycerophosphate synthase
MATTTQNVPETVLAPDEGRRAGRELVLEYLFRPLSSLLVPPLLRVRVPPAAVVLANTAAGLLAAAAVAWEELVVGAFLLQLKTLLDNTDGQLARASGKAGLAGRYLDTVADLVVNAALFAALGHVTGRPLLAAAGFVALTLVLSVDFQLTELAREAYGLRSQRPASSGGQAERVLGRVYGAVFAPQDRLVRSLSSRRFDSAVGADVDPDRLRQVRQAYVDPLTLTVLANLGLSTQLLVLGACLVLGLPETYLWLAIAGLLLLVPLQLRRERLVRRECAG